MIKFIETSHLSMLCLHRCSAIDVMLWRRHHIHSMYFPYMARHYPPQSSGIFGRSKKLAYHLSQITLDPHGPSSLAGIRAHGARPKLLFSLLGPIAQYLPHSITIHGSDHDLGSALLADDQREAANAAIQGGRYLTQEELRRLEKRIGRVKVKGTASACPVGSLGWNYSLATQEGRHVDLPHQGKYTFPSVSCRSVFDSFPHFGLLHLLLWPSTISCDHWHLAVSLLSNSPSTCFLLE